MVDTPAKSSESLTVGMLAQRLDGMDEAIRLLQGVADRMPTPALVQASVDSEKELTKERFKGVADILAERKTQVESALTAQKESAAETKTSLSELITQTAQTLSTKAGGLERETTDIKTRLTTIESRTIVTKEASGDNRSLIFSIIAAFVGIGGLVFGIMALVRTAGIG